MIFEDAAIQAQLLKQAATLGHVRIHPKEQQSTLSQLPPGHAKHLFTCSSLAATALFETMGAHGTNIVVQEGAQIVQADVFARTQDDGLDLMWEPKPGDQGKLQAAASKIKEAFWFVGKDVDEADEAKPTPTKKSSEPVKSSKDDYRVRQLRRSP